jgi:uncharacterized protein (TIGR00730 family)
MEPNTEKVYPPSSYLVAYKDIEFLKRDDLRPVRLQLELLKPELIMEEHKIVSTVVVFGSARLLSREEAEKNLADVEKKAAQNPDQPDVQKGLVRARRLVENSRYYEEAREFARLVSSTCQLDRGNCDFVMVTGGGPGIMEAANRGAYEAGAKSVGLNITLPLEQKPNPYITPELCFQFHYFALRKMHFLLRAKALAVFPGGFGTLDEMFETLTLIQTRKMKAIPILLFGKSYWSQAVNFEFLVEQGTISPEDLQLVSFVETAAEAWQKIMDFYGIENPE